MYSNYEFYDNDNFEIGGKKKMPKKTKKVSTKDASLKNKNKIRKKNNKKSQI